MDKGKGQIKTESRVLWRTGQKERQNVGQGRAGQGRADGRLGQIIGDVLATKKKFTCKGIS